MNEVPIARVQRFLLRSERTPAVIRLIVHPELHPLFEALGYALGFAAYRRARTRLGDVVNDQQRWRVIAAAAIGALAGSRLLALLEQAPHMRLTLSQLFMPGGGKTIVGGLLGGWLSVEIAKKIAGIHTRTGDLFVIPLCIGTAVGRIGCLLASLADDTYGTPTLLPWGVDFGDGITRHPTQAYEILFLIVLGLGLHHLKKRQLPNGALFRYFMAAYLTWRLLIDLLKPEPLIAGMNVIQWACLGGLAVLIAARRRPVSVPAPDQGRQYV
jgi:phosphatidylglycerol---prolipoprotein diacylglyceryl transferase